MANQLFAINSAIRSGNRDNAIISALNIGPALVNWLGNSNVAQFDMTPVIKSAGNFSLRGVLIDNSNCMVGATFTDGVGNIYRVPAGYQGQFQIAWYPGQQMFLQVPNVMSGLTTASGFPYATNVPSITKISFFNYDVTPFLWKGPTFKTNLVISSNAYEVSDNKLTWVYSFVNAAYTYAAPLDITSLLWGVPVGADQIFDNIKISQSFANAGAAANISNYLYAGTNAGVVPVEGVFWQTPVAAGFNGTVMQPLPLGPIYLNTNEDLGNAQLWYTNNGQFVAGTTTLQATVTLNI